MVQNSDSQVLRSGTLAKAVGVSPDTIRHYERIGVLPQSLRTDSGHRLYPRSAVERVIVVRRALRIGFTLAELAEVLRVRDAGGAPCRRVYQLALEKLKDVSADIAALKRTERYLKKILSDWEQRMERSGKGEKSYLLHTLGDPLAEPDAATIQFRRKRKS